MQIEISGPILYSLHQIIIPALEGAYWPKRTSDLGLCTSSVILSAMTGYTELYFNTQMATGGLKFTSFK